MINGTVMKGMIKKDTEMMFGPDRNGNFRTIKIFGIHENKTSIKEAHKMWSVSLCIDPLAPSGSKYDKPISFNEIKHGQCLINFIPKSP